MQNTLALLLFVALLVYIFARTTDHPRYDLIVSDSNLLWHGLVTTLWTSLFTLLLSMLFGFVLYLLGRSPIPFVKALVSIFQEIVMGTPLLVMIFLCVYVLGVVIHIENKLVLGVTGMTLYMSPYLANSFSSAISVIDEDQYLVMDLYRFTAYQRYRYVIFPQMLRPLMPSLLNNLSNIIKGSALLRIVAITEISYVITVISQRNWATIEGYLIMWAMYLIITIPLSILAQYIGRRLTV